MVLGIICITLSGFAVGFALCNFLWSAFGPVRKPRDMEAESGDDECDCGEEYSE